jgi:uncharacterized small protein (DUF1192 family)
MEEDGLPLHTPNQGFVPRKIDTLSVEELTEYIAKMEAEISRVREMVVAKKQVREGAESLFKK